MNDHPNSFDQENTRPMQPQPWLEPELEARVVAWVAGEASPFEAAELERLCAEKPELALFKRRMETVDGLVNAAVRPEKEPLRMSEERRARLLDTLRSAETDVSAKPSGGGAVVVMPRKRVNWFRVMRWTAAAACVPLTGLLVLRSIPHFGKVRPLEPERPAPAETLLGPQLSKAEPAPQVITLSMPRIDDSSYQAREDARAESPLNFIQSKDVAATTAGASGLTPSSVATDSAAFSERMAPLQVEYPKPLFAGTPRPIPGAPTAAVGGLVAGDALKLRDASNLNGSVMFGNRMNAPVPVPTDAVAPAATTTLNAGAVQLSPFEVSAPREGVALAAGSVALSASTTGGYLDTEFRAADEAKKRDADAPPPARAAPPPPVLDETSTAKEAVSTFSLHVSDVSFRLAHAALARGELPDAARIRPEEFYNAFNYGDPLPTVAEKVGCRIEQAAHPFMQQRNLVRIAMKVPATGRDAAQPLRLTVLLDTSGSMERDDRAATVRAAFKELIALLGPTDRITLVGFARQPRLLAENVPGNQAGWLIDLIARTPAEGGTNMEEALRLGGQLARRHQLSGAQNRIIMLTDGAANLGNAEPGRLAQAIEALRMQGVAFDACGVGLDGLDDAVLEALTRKGDGRYYVLNSPAAADAGFARQIAGALRPAAENVKLQVRFNPARVGHYRLIGFDQHRLRAEDFRNDKVDAAELAAEEAAIALYQVEVLPQGTGELGEVFVRFRDAATGMMVERSWPIAHDASARAFDRATPSLQLAGAAAFVAEKLRGGAPADTIRLRDLEPVISRLRSHYAHEPRVQELVTMFTQLRRIRGE